MLYLGDPSKLQQYFDTPEVTTWASERARRPMGFTQWLQAGYPEAWQHYATQHDGAPPVVLEAISEGVSFSTLAHCAGDYLAGLRPRLSKLEKAKAVAFAFEQYGKPYDFDFDFATDDTLVCTELVYRAYQPREGMQGLSFSLREMAGRKTLPANDIVAQFASELGTEGQQLDFIVFVDGREKHERAFLSDRASFAASHRRPKWDIVQK